MKKLFEDITQGLVNQGWHMVGGNDTTFLMLSRGGDVIKVFADNYEDPNHFIVRYSVRADDGWYSPKKELCHPE